LKPISDAYRTFEVDPPYNSEFEHVKGSVECPYGLIDIEYTRSESSVTLALTVPFGTTATVRFPSDMKKAEYRRTEEESISAQGGDVTLTHGLYTVNIQL
jgi:hypothetical protein